jgi:hypothetical protein
MRRRLARHVPLYNVSGWPPERHVKETVNLTVVIPADTQPSFVGDPLRYRLIVQAEPGALPYSAPPSVSELYVDYAPSQISTYFDNASTVVCNELQPWGAATYAPLWIHGQSVRIMWSVDEGDIYSVNVRATYVLRWSAYNSSLPITHDIALDVPTTAAPGAVQSLEWNVPLLPIDDEGPTGVECIWASTRSVEAARYDPAQEGVVSTFQAAIRPAPSSLSLLALSKSSWTTGETMAIRWAFSTE